ncbi:MAG: tetratricopeptide repeat protein [Armatimonadota bacterium]
MHCPSCNENIAGKDNFCRNCGLPLKESVDKSCLTGEQINKMIQFSFVYEIENLIDKAIENYTTLLSRVENGYPDVHFKLACAYEAKGMAGKAISELQKAIKINPNYIEARRKLGELYNDENLTEQAIEEFKRVLSVKVKYTYADVHNNLGVAYEKAQLYELAERSYKQAIKINPRYGKAHFNLGNLYSDIGQNFKAVKEYKKAIKSGFTNSLCYNNLAISMIMENKKKEAEKILKVLVNDYPDYISARRNLANLYIEMKKNDSAREQIEVILKMDPEDAEARSMLDIVKAE